MAKSAKSKAKPQQKTSASPAVAAPRAEDDFVAPEDLIGSDLAAQLQDVLDEARLQLDGMEAIAPRSDAAHDEFADAPHRDTESDAAEEDAAEADDAVFESPEEVFATAQTDNLVNGAAESAPSDAGKANPADDNMDEFEAQLKELLAMGAGESAAPASSSFEQSSAAEIPPAAFEDALDQQAQVVGSELDDMTKFIDEALAAPQDSTSTDEPTIAAGAGSTMTQLDEFLAGHADHAVSDEFETVQDLLGGSGVDAAQSPATAQVEPRSDVRNSPGDDDDEFASPEQLFGVATPPLEMVGAGTAPVNGLPANATAQAPSAPPATSPVAEDVHGDSGKDATETKAARLRKVGLTLGRIVVVTTQQTYRVCSVLNRPLQNASASTRRNVGMIGLITLANASLLILGKLLNLWG